VIGFFGRSTKTAFGGSTKAETALIDPEKAVSALDTNANNYQPGMHVLLHRTGVVRRSTTVNVLQSLALFRRTVRLLMPQK